MQTELINSSTNTTLDIEQIKFNSYMVKVFNHLLDNEYIINCDNLNEAYSILKPTLPINHHVVFSNLNKNSPSSLSNTLLITEAHNTTTPGWIYSTDKIKINTLFTLTLLPFETNIRNSANIEASIQTEHIETDNLLDLKISDILYTIKDSVQQVSEYIFYLYTYDYLNQLN